MKKLLILSLLFSNFVYSQSNSSTSDKFYEFTIHINSLILGDDVLKLGSDLIINTKNKSVKYTSIIPILGDEINWDLNYTGYSEDGMIVTINYKIGKGDDPMVKMGKISFNNLNSKLQFQPSCFACERLESGLYSVKISSKYVE
jgi:hypothetical protein